MFWFLHKTRCFKLPACENQFPTPLPKNINDTPDQRGTCLECITQGLCWHFLVLAIFWHFVTSIHLQNSFSAQTKKVSILSQLLHSAEKGYIKLQASSCWNTSPISPLPNPVLGQRNTLNGQIFFISSNWNWTHLHVFQLYVETDCTCTQDYGHFGLEPSA